MTQPQSKTSQTPEPVPSKTPVDKLHEAQRFLSENKQPELAQAVAEARQQLAEKPKSADEGKAPADHPGAQGLEDGTRADARGDRSAGDKDKARK